MPPDDARLTVEALHRPVERRDQLIRTPRLARDALQIAWRASPRHLIGLISTQVVVSAAVAGQLLVGREIIQDLVAVNNGADASTLYAPLGAFAVLGGLAGALNALAAYQQRLLVELVGRYAFDKIIAVGSAVEFRVLETPSFYDELQRAISTGQFRIIDMVTSLSQLLAALFTTVSIAVVLLLLSPLLLLLVALAAVPVLLAAIRNSRASYAFEYAMTSESRERAYVLNLMTSRSAGKEVRLLGLGQHLRRRYEALTDERLIQVRAFLRARFRVSVSGNLAGALGMTVALAALVVLLTQDELDVADALTAALAMQQLGLRLTQITSGLSRLLEAGMFIDDYHSFLELAPAALPEEKRRESAAHLRPFNRVSVEGVSFQYPGAARPALEGVDLRVEPGEVVAVVGENGSGKTTLVKLISQLYAPTAGRICWNGVDAATLSSSEVAGDLTVLFQDYLQYHLSALENIVFGRIDKHADRDAAVAAARQAGADEFIRRLSDGYDTRLGLEFHGGHELSVGQWQRLSLARAFFRAASFLILDEPTAALDPRAERALFDQIHQLAEGRSVLLISHRFSSTRAADRIYVLERGQVIESGPHDDLIARGGRYAELFELQVAAYLGTEKGIAGS